VLCYWLLLRGIYWSVMLPIWVLIIPDLSTRVHCSGAAETPSSEAGRILARNVREFCLQVSLFMHLGFFLTFHKTFDMGPTALLPLRRKSCYVFLSLLKIHRPRLGLNLLTLAQVVSTTIIITPPRSTTCYVAAKSFPNDEIAWLLSLACAAEKNPSAEKQQCRISVVMPRIINT
jgi:hypothetical protein